MAREFLTRNQTDEDDSILEQITGRENEIASYDLNIASLTVQLESLDAGDAEGRNVIADRIAAERKQLAVSERAYNSMLALLPNGARRDAALARRAEKVQTEDPS